MNVATARLAQIVTMALGATALTACAYYDDGYYDGYHGGRHYSGGYYDGYDGGYNRGYHEKRYKGDSRRYRDNYRDYDHHDRRGDYRDSYGDGGYGGYQVCDSDGDRCYGSSEPYWNYREYYRRHGYRWQND